MQIQYVITCKIEYKITACSGGLVEIVVSRQSDGPGSTSPVDDFVFFFFLFILLYLQLSFYQKNETVETKVILSKISRQLFASYLR